LWRSVVLVIGGSRSGRVLPPSPRRRTYA
jgi:hypothetical protein